MPDSINQLQVLPPKALVVGASLPNILLIELLFEGVGALSG